MNRDGIAEPRYPDAPEAPGRGEAHVWRLELPTVEGRAVARAALREILGSYLGIAAEAVALELDPGGKPRLDGAKQQGPEGSVSGGAPISFNLSHSGGLALVAVAAGGTEVGIDVERLRPRRDLVRLAARWLPAADADAVAAATAGERETVFYAAWTRHEARTKCAGSGLSGPPPGPEIVALPLEVDRGYAAALAVDLGAEPISVQRYDRGA
jgi:phosphopantetheinyl transferase